MIEGDKAYLFFYIGHFHIVLFLLSNIAFLKFYITTEPDPLMPKIAMDFADFHSPLDDQISELLSSTKTMIQPHFLTKMNRYRRLQRYPP